MSLDEKTRKWKEQLDAKRVAAVACRHCGGRLPCWSEYGDVAVGRRHSRQSWKRTREREP